MLKDPRRFSEESLLVPVSLGPYLQNIDGTNTVQEIIEAASSTGEQPIPVAILGDLLGRLDQMFLLENGAYTDEMQKRLDEYRRAPARKAALPNLHIRVITTIYGRTSTVWPSRTCWVRTMVNLPGNDPLVN